jgi:hypothetical protein
MHISANRAVAGSDAPARRTSAISRLTRSLSALAVTLTVFGAAFAALGPASAAAEGTPNISGTWSCCGTGTAAVPKTWTITDSGGVLSGMASDTSATDYSPLSGSINGTSVTIVEGPYTSVPSYTATFVGTVSANGESMSGTWSDTFGRKGETWTAMRTSGPINEEEIKKAEEAKKKKEEEEKAGKRKAAIQVNCDTFYPGLPNEYFQCTAQVGDASGQSPAEIPTGTVAFAINPGGGGGILGSHTCTLVPSQTGGASSFCAIEYVPPASGIALGSQPPLTATYSGSSVFQSASTQPLNQPASNNPLSPKNVFESLCVKSFLEVCEGVVPPPQLLSQICLSPLTPEGTASATDENCDNTAQETITLSANQSSLVADASCPPAAEGLSSCELQAYVNGTDLDPTINARLEYDLNYATYLKEVAVQRAAVLQGTKEFIDKIPVEGNEQERKEAEERHAMLSAKLQEQINNVYDIMEHRGKRLAEPYEPLDQNMVNKFCEMTVSKQDCETFWKTIGEVLKTSVDTLSASKANLGVNVPFHPPAKAQGASTSSVHHRASGRPHEMVLASSKSITLTAGKSAKITLAIPAFVRARLKAAFAKHERAINAHLVVQILTNTGTSTTRTIPVRIKLVAKRPRRPTKKK